METNIIIWISAIVLYSVSVKAALFVVDSYMDFIKLKHRDLSNKIHFLYIIYVFVPLINIYTIIDLLTDKKWKNHRRIKRYEKKRLRKILKSKKYLNIILILLSLNVTGQQEIKPYQSLQFTVSPIKGIAVPIRGGGYGIVYEYDEIILSAEHSKPECGNETMSFVKLGVGYVLWAGNISCNNVRVQTILMWNKYYNYVGNNTFINPERIRIWSTEIGFSTEITNKLLGCLYIDIVNFDARFGFGFKF